MDFVRKLLFTKSFFGKKNLEKKRIVKHLSQKRFHKSDERTLPSPYEYTYKTTMDSLTSQRTHPNNLYDL